MSSLKTIIDTFARRLDSLERRVAKNDLHNKQIMVLLKSILEVLYKRKKSKHTVQDLIESMRELVEYHETKSTDEINLLDELIEKSANNESR